MIELFFKGGWVMYPILACSLASWAVILERCAYYLGTRVPPRRIDELICAPGKSPREERYARLVRCHQEFGGESAQDRERVARWEAAPFLRDDNRGLALLAAVAAIGPLLGLFGTVLGMVELFRSLAASGAKPQFASLAGGIWTALLTTGFGLIAALPALAAHQMFDHWASRRAQLLEEFHGRLETRR